MTSSKLWIKSKAVVAAIIGILFQIGILFGVEAEFTADQVAGPVANIIFFIATIYGRLVATKSLKI